MSSAQCIMGADNFREKSSDIVLRIIQNIRLHGIHVNPIYCEIIQKNLSTIHDKILCSYGRTLDILENVLKINPKIDCIRHPFVNANQRHFYFKEAGPGVIHFHILPKKFRLNSKYQRNLELLSKKIGIRYITSFGHAFDSIDCFPKKDETGFWLRLAIGYANDPDFNRKLMDFIDAI